MKTYPKPFGVCIVGGYSLDLYCANDEHAYKKGKDSFAGSSKADSFRYAKSAGWKISESKDIAICPDCQIKEQK
jgi:hypothetical protein